MIYLCVGFKNINSQNKHDIEMCHFVSYSYFGINVKMLKILTWYILRFNKSLITENVKNTI